MKKILSITGLLLAGNFFGLFLLSGETSGIQAHRSFYSKANAVFIQPLDTVEPFYVETTSSVRLFKDMDNISSVILYIPSGERVEVFEEIDNYYSASFNGEKGYILKKKAKPLNFSEPESNPATSVSAPVNKMDEKARYAYLKSKYDIKTANALFRHQIWKGMSSSMAKDSWGSPLTMDRFLGNDEKYEEWKYSKYILVFDQGKLSGWKKRQTP